LRACEGFSPELAAAAVARALARGLTAGGVPAPDEFLLDGPARETSRQLDELDFDGRMRASRAVIIAARALDEGTLAGRPAFEIATRARQAGVPAFAVAAASSLNDFDARILDLQAILIAADARALARTGRRLAELI
jgi:glycerate kinase